MIFHVKYFNSKRPVFTLQLVIFTSLKPNNSNKNTYKLGLGKPLKILISCLAFFASLNLSAASSPAADSVSGIYQGEKRTLLQQISAEKVRIRNDYKSADARFFNLVDSISGFIDAQNVSAQKRNIYYSRLNLFLKNIDRYYSDSYFKSGTYLAVLSYFPVMVQWDQEGMLLVNLKNNSSFTIKAMRLVPDETVAEEFLSYFLVDNPDDIFKYAEEFDDRKTALAILERAVRLAPESAKRYYSTGNAVSTTLWRSQDFFVKKSFEIFYHFGVKSRAYLLLDAIINNNMPLPVADSIGNHPDELFSIVMQLSAKYKGRYAYSFSQFVSEYSVNTMRKMNDDSLNGTKGHLPFQKYSADEMFTLMSYGCQEVSAERFRSMIEILRKKTGGGHVNAPLVSSNYKDKIKYLVDYCSKNKFLDVFLSMADDSKRDDLLSLTTLKEKENIPPFKVFGKTSSAPHAESNHETVDLSKIPHARPAKPVTTNEMLAVKAPVAPKKATALPPTVTKPSAPTLSPVSVSSINSATASISGLYVSSSDMTPIPLPERIEPVKITLDEKTKALVSLKKNIFQSLQDIPVFINKDYAEEVLSYAAQKEPDELLKKIDAFKVKFFCKKILEQCALTAPISVKRYLYDPQQPVNYILRYSKNPVVKKIIEIAPSIGSSARPLLLLDDIASGKITIKDAVTLSGDPNKLFSSLIGIISRPEYVGKYSIDHEMRDYSLRFIREINNKIANGSAQPFSSVENFNSAELYFLMLYGREEVFSSTFSGLFYRFMQKLPDNDGDAFLHSINNNQFRDFLSLCSNYGTLGPFLAGFPTDTKAKLLTAYISNLEDEKDDLSSIVSVAEAISNLNDNLLLSILQSNIKKEYERVQTGNDQIGISIYGVLSSMISGNAKVDVSWYKKVSQQFKISPVNSLPTATLFSKELDCVEQMYFYDDEDGRSSFINFMAGYKGKAGWAIENKNGYVRIYSRTGMHIEILANRPETEEAGLQAIKAYLEEKNLSPTVIVHRGHSFHTEATLEKVPATAKLIFVGSCGGFYKISIALENAPEAHIISTKQVGTKAINDVMLLALNETIRNGEDIEWNDFWDEMREKLGTNQYFSDYVPPQKNLEAIFIRAYYKTLGV